MNTLIQSFTASPLKTNELSNSKFINCSFPFPRQLRKRFQTKTRFFSKSSHQEYQCCPLTIQAVPSTFEMVPFITCATVAYLRKNCWLNDKWRAVWFTLENFVYKPTAWAAVGHSCVQEPKRKMFKLVSYTAIDLQTWDSVLEYQKVWRMCLILLCRLVET